MAPSNLYFHTKPWTADGVHRTCYNRKHEGSHNKTASPRQRAPKGPVGPLSVANKRHRGSWLFRLKLTPKDINLAQCQKRPFSSRAVRWGDFAPAERDLCSRGGPRLFSLIIKQKLYTIKKPAACESFCCVFRTKQHECQQPCSCDDYVYGMCRCRERGAIISNKRALMMIVMMTMVMKTTTRTAMTKTQVYVWLLFWFLLLRRYR